MRQWRWLGAIAAAGLVLSGMWTQTRGVDLAATSAYEAQLRDLQRLDRTLNEDVLRARFQLLGSYDPLVASRRAIEETRRRLRAPPALGDQAALDRALDAYEAELTHKLDVIERFKSRSSVLRNSQRYLPTLAGEVAAAADRDAPASGLGDAVRALLTDVLVYELSADEARAPALLRAADALADRRAELPAADAHTLSLLLAHVRAITTTKPEVDALIREVIDAPIVAREAEVAQAWGAELHAAERVAGRWRLALYAASVGLVGVVAYASRRLNQTFDALAEANASLERRVLERTAALDARNDAMRLLLDNVEQGFVTVDRDGRLAAERSASFCQWLEDQAERPLLWDWLARTDPRAASWFALGWDELFADVLPFEVVADQLPRRIRRGERTLGLELRPLPGAAGALLVVTDVTERVAREHAEAESRDLLHVLDHVLTDKAAFLEFTAELDRLVRSAVADDTPREQRLRDLHTIKGNASLFGISVLADRCHALEGRLAEGEDLDAGTRRDLAALWATFDEKLAPLLHKPDAGAVELSGPEYEALLTAVRTGVDPRDLERALEDLRREPVARRLTRLAQQLRVLGERLGRPMLVVTVEADDLRLDHDRYAPLWAALVHALRNAVDHGIEPPDERVRSGKTANGRLWLTARREADALALELRDDGRGVDWARVAEKARERGLPADTPAQRTAALFEDGLSTRDEVSELSGRGVGMGAVRRAVEALGGTLTLDSEPGLGTSLRLVLPLTAARDAA